MQKKSALQILLLSAIWGASFLLIRISGETFPPFWVALMRSGLGALLLWSILLARRTALPARRALPWLAVVGLFNNAIPFTCFAWGERVIPSNTAAVLNATTPIFTLLLTGLVYRARIAWNVTLGVLLGFAGVLLVVQNQSARMQAQVPGTAFARGVALVSFGALGYAIAALVAKAKLQGVEPIALAASQLGSAAVLVSPLAAFGPHPSHPHATTLLAIAALGFLGSGVAYLLFFHVLRTVPATHAVAVTYLLPIWGVFWGLIAHEPVGLITVLGVAITISGLALMNIRRGLPATPALQTSPTARRRLRAHRRAEGSSSAAESWRLRPGLWRPQFVPAFQPHHPR